VNANEIVIDVGQCNRMNVNINLFAVRVGQTRKGGASTFAWSN
jgi:hypothetical protein